jgi:phospholipid/cholesterol/gamma-HCH transport system ATP-binding protein
MHGAFKFTGVIVSHDIPEVFEVTDRVAMLANGVIIEAGTTAEFVASKNPIVRQFLQKETEGPLAVL